MCDVLKPIGGASEQDEQLVILDHICRRCFALDYHIALAAYWRLFPYGLPFHSDEMLPSDAATITRGTHD